MPIKVVVSGSPQIYATKKPSGAISTSSTVFVGAANISAEVNTAIQTANLALYVANNALPLTGGEITGNLIVDQTFTAIIDGGNNAF